MTTTFDPGKEPALHRLTPSGASVNGKPEAALSQQANVPADFWTGAAPKSLRKEQLAPDAALDLYWAKRKPPKPLAAWFGASKTPLRWALLAPALRPLTAKLLDAVDQFAADRKQRVPSRKETREARNLLSEWLDGAAHAAPDYSFAVGCLAAAHALAAVGGAIPAAIAWRALDMLSETARHARKWNLGAEAAVEDVVASQLLGGELPLTLAYLFPEMAPLRRLAKSGADYLGEGMQELLNGQGLPRGAHLSVLRPLAACWTRCQTFGEHAKRGRIEKKARGQYRKLVRQAVRWSAPDATQLISDGTAEPWDAEFLRALLKTAGSKRDRAAARNLLGKSLTGKRRTKTTPAAASYDCEWSGLTVMRRGWYAEDAVVAIDYSRPEMQLDLWAHGRRILSGPVVTASHRDGNLLRPIGPWESLCWFHDKDVNYLELVLPLQDGSRLERQIVLALRDDFFLIADHLQSGEPATLEHELKAPLGSGLIFCSEGETRDALLVDGTPISRLMPLALPEWRTDPRGGQLTAFDGCVRLEEKAAGRSLACPLFVDLSPSRSGGQATWRRLTVAQALQIQTPDAAVAYRVQSGEEQWVYYRSQGPRGNRTFLGQNTSSECLLARFLAPSGEVKSLLEIEG